MAPVKPTARRSERPVPTNPMVSMGKERRVISTAAIFKRVASKVTTPMPQHHGRKSFASNASVLSKKPPYSARKVPEHALTVEFTDATSSYGSELLEDATTTLERTHSDLVKRLQEGPPQQDDVKQRHDAPNGASLIAQVKKSDQRKHIPFHEEIVRVGGGDKPFRASIHSRMGAFQTFIEIEARKIAQLKAEYDQVLAEIDQFAQEVIYQEGGSVKGKEGKSVTLQEKLEGQVKKLEVEIEGLGKEELARLEKAQKDEAAKNKKMLQFMRDLNG